MHRHATAADKLEQIEHPSDGKKDVTRQHPGPGCDSRPAEFLQVVVFAFDIQVQITALNNNFRVEFKIEMLALKWFPFATLFLIICSTKNYFSRYYRFTDCSCWKFMHMPWRSRTKFTVGLVYRSGESNFFGSIRNCAVQTVDRSQLEPSVFEWSGFIEVVTCFTELKAVSIETSRLTTQTPFSSPSDHNLHKISIKSQFEVQI